MPIGFRRSVLERTGYARKEVGAAVEESFCALGYEFRRRRRGILKDGR